MIDVKKIYQSRVARNASWLIGGNIVNKLIAFAVGIWTARYLGPSNYGLINYSLAFTTFFFSLCTLGLNSIIVKELIDNPVEEGEVMGTTLVLQALSSIISILMIGLIVYYIDYGESITFIVTLLCSIGLFFQMMDTIKYWFQSKLLSKYSAIATIVAYLCSSLYKVFLLINNMEVELFALATSVDYFVMAVFLMWMYKKHGGARFSFSMSRAKIMLSKSYHYILAGLMVSIYAATDRLMLKQMVDESEVGYYGTAVSICNIWVFVLAAIIDSFYPVIMKLRQESIANYEKKNTQLYAIVFYCSVIVGVIITIVAECIISKLYGSAYMSAVAPLRICVWYIAFSYLGVARNAWIVSENLQKYLTPIYIVAAMLNVILNYILIPLFQSTGAAFASFITQLSTILLIPLFIKPMRSNVKLMIRAILLKIS